jgi:hypothetical protein
MNEPYNVIDLGAGAFGADRSASEVLLAAAPPWTRCPESTMRPSPGEGRDLVWSVVLAASLVGLGVPTTRFW